jgi:hypothetical protein
MDGRRPEDPVIIIYRRILFVRAVVCCRETFSFRGKLIVGGT